MEWTILVSVITYNLCSPFFSLLENSFVPTYTLCWLLLQITLQNASLKKEEFYFNSELWVIPLGTWGSQSPCISSGEKDELPALYWLSSLVSFMEWVLPALRLSSHFNEAHLENPSQVYPEACLFSDSGSCQVDSITYNISCITYFPFMLIKHPEQGIL